MKKINSLIYKNGKPNSVTEMMSVREKWRKTVPEQVNDVTTPVQYKNKKLTVFVHDNIWLNELSYMKDLFAEKLGENGLEISDILYKYRPAFETFDNPKRQTEYEIADNVKNYIENIVKKIDNKEIAESRKRFLTAFFKKVNFQEWRIK